MTRKRLIWMLVTTGAALVVVLVLGATLGRPPHEFAGSHMEPAYPAPAFTLHSDSGEVSLADFRGKAVALFFGYTSCPDVCPTTLLRLSRMLDALGDDASRVQVVFISIDPERDTPQRVAAYARAVNPSIIGATGSPQEIATVAKAYGIYYAKKPGSAATGYLMDHTAAITVVNPAGEVELIWSPTAEPEQMADDIRAIL